MTTRGNPVRHRLGSRLARREGLPDLQRRDEHEQHGEGRHDNRAQFPARQRGGGEAESQRQPRRGEVRVVVVEHDPRDRQPAKADTTPWLLMMSIRPVRMKVNGADARSGSTRGYSLRLLLIETERCPDKRAALVRAFSGLPTW